jgi:hypothetical protein
MGSTGDVPIYFLLGESLTSDWVANFLGRVTSNLSDPIADYEPEKSLDLRKIVEDIYEKPAEFSNIEKVLNNASEAGARMKIERLLEIFAQKAGKSRKEITAPLFRRYKMSRVPQKFEKLMDNQEYRASVEGMFKRTEGKPIGLVTGLLTCTDMTITTAKENKKDLVLQAGISKEVVMMATGIPCVGLEAGGHVYQFAYNYGTGTAHGEMVLAISYYELSLAKSENGLWKLLRRPIEKPAVEIVKISKTPLRGDFEGFFSGAGDDTEIAQATKRQIIAENIERAARSMTEEEYAEMYNFEFCFEPTQLSESILDKSSQAAASD